jgi:transmembrane sensor
MSIDQDRREAALGWVVRVNDPEFHAWDEFTAWLEADAANADAFHALEQSETEMRPLVAQVSAGETIARPRRRAFVLAASAAAFAALTTAIVAPRLAPVDYVTAPGEIRMISLGGKDRLVMNGATKLALSGWDRRNVRLESGQALLELRDPAKGKVEVTSGDLKLVDVGTVFEVSREAHETRVLVSEGAIVADPKGARLKLGPGQRLDAKDGAGVLVAQTADAGSVGAFQRGQLIYVDEPLDHVVADIRRSTGLDISADEAISARRFTGTLSVADVRRNPQSLGPLVGVSIMQSGRTWKLGGRI